MSLQMVSAFVVQWRSPSMAAPAFWYYRDEANAQGVYDKFVAERRCEVKPPAPRQVPATTPFGDEAWLTIGSKRRAPEGN